MGSSTSLDLRDQYSIKIEKKKFPLMSNVSVMGYLNHGTSSSHRARRLL